MQVADHTYQDILEVVPKVVLITNVVLEGRGGEGEGGKEKR